MNQLVVSGDFSEVAIGQRFSAAMAIRGHTASTLAEITGTHRQTIWRYQTGRSVPSFPVMAKLASVLRVRLDYLAYGEGKIEKGRR